MTHFMLIIPRHKQALEMLVDQKKKDALGGIGVGALREEDDPFTLDQIVDPLTVRGLIEDLTETPMGQAGKYFVRITPLGQYCLGCGYMMREARKSTEAEMKKYATEVSAAFQGGKMDAKKNPEHDEEEESTGSEKPQRGADQAADEEEEEVEEKP